MSIGYIDSKIDFDLVWKNHVHTITVNTHTIERFIWRYSIISKSFKPKSFNEVYEAILNVIYKCDLVELPKTNTSRPYQNRIAIGKKDFCFIVDLESDKVRTFMLTGEMAKFNGINHHYYMRRVL